MLERVPLGIRIVADYRLLLESGERSIPENLQKIFDAAKKPKRGGKGKTKASSSNPSHKPRKKQKKKQRSPTPVVVEEEEEEESGNQTLSDIPKDETVQNEEEDTTSKDKPS
ncbi:hypothetical protein L1887_17436 [Cichorium endivia]|nr:hypothetical protein L1887_17436 [Cichorium endivia]